jgi:hypothetical protein
MTDKKSCQNCKRGICPNGIDQFPECCFSWKRDPRLWLSIPPTEPGWYWYKRYGEIGIMEVKKYDIDIWKNDSSWSGLFLWQGPISPEEE